MSDKREVMGRIKSVKDTMKITNAMYMISSVKLRRARQAVTGTEPYFLSLQHMIGRMLYQAPSVHHKYFDPKTEKAEKERKAGYVVITGDKGLAGAYNHNVLKLVQKKLDARGSGRLFVIGEMGRHYFIARKTPIESDFQYSVENYSLRLARSIAAMLMELYNAGELDEIYLVYTQLVNTMTAEAKLIKVLPLKEEDFPYQPEEENQKETFNFHPSVSAVMDAVVPDVLSGLIYGALVESYCSEQNCRMMAMRAANDSAKEMLSNLSLMYNRIRQAQITQEITEIASGAKAQKRKKNDPRRVEP